METAAMNKEEITKAGEAAGKMIGKMQEDVSRMIRKMQGDINIAKSKAEKADREMEKAWMELEQYKKESKENEAEFRAVILYLIDHYVRSGTAVIDAVEFEKLKMGIISGREDIYVGQNYGGDYLIGGHKA